MFAEAPWTSFPARIAGVVAPAGARAAVAQVRVIPGVMVEPTVVQKAAHGERMLAAVLSLNIWTVLVAEITLDRAHLFM